MFAEETVRDVRVGLRMLVKERGFCALAIFVLALGIGAVTTQFSIVNGIMLRGFSFPNATRLADVRFIDPTTPDRLRRQLARCRRWTSRSSCRCRSRSS